MKPISQLAAVVLLALCSASYGQAPREEADAKKELTAQYAAISRAFEKNRMDEAIATISPDFVSLQPGGRSLSRDQVIADLKRQRESMRSVQWKRKIDTVGLKGGVLIVLVNGRLSAVTGEPGRLHKMLFTAKSMDTWKRLTEAASESGAVLKPRWMLMESTLLEAHAEMDGKPLDLHPPDGGR